MQKQLSDCGTVLNLLVSVTTLSTTKIDVEDLGLKKEDIPKEIIKALATMQLVDPKLLTPLNNCRKRAERCVEKVGTRFFGSSVYFVPDTEIKSVTSELNDIRTEFYNQLFSLIASYDTQCENWAKHCDEKYPGWGALLRSAKKPSADVKNACTFNYIPCSVGAPKQDDLGSIYESTLGGLHIQLLTEIALVMTNLYDNSYKNKDRAGHQTLITISNARKKLFGLRFISSDIGLVVNLIDQTLRNIPTRKNVTGNDFLAVSHLIQLLSNPQRVIEHVNSHTVDNTIEVSPTQIKLIESDLNDMSEEISLDGMSDESSDIELKPEVVVATKSFDKTINLTDWL